MKIFERKQLQKFTKQNVNAFCIFTALLLSLLFCNAIAISAESSDLNERQEINFNKDWKFIKGEQADAEAADYDDSAWQAVRLPHDWAIAGPFNPNGSGSTGKLPWQGIGWYRKEFTLNSADEGKRVYLNFDGVMAFPKIYINGQLAGQWDYGYTPFWIDATPLVKFGQKNVIAVRVDTRQHRSRWYPGAGIYRDVTMLITGQIHIEHWGTFVTNPFVSDMIASVRVRNTMENHLDSDSLVDISVTISDPEGKELMTKTTYLTVPSGGSKDIVVSFPVDNPQLWDIISPKLYSVKTTVRLADKVVDTGTSIFGIRTYEFTPDDGFHLNGRRVQLHGVCLHHDLGPLGSAFNMRAMERELQIMKEMGVNAIRTSHNPPAKGLVELCSKMGLVVVDEAFDKWDGTADLIGNKSLQEHGEQNLRNFVMRDRNNPSVIVWSIGNEIGNQSRNNRPTGNGKSDENVTMLSDIVRKCDPTRPVGLGEDKQDSARELILDSLDVVGFNYSRRYAQFRQANPQIPLFYSESASTVSTRGFYSLPFPANKTQYDRQAQQVSSYDLTATSWSDIPDVEFQTTVDDNFLAGEFVWTGFDYLGEPTPVGQAKSSYFGIVDLSGIPKDRYYLYRSLWRPDVTTLHILPHWNWPDRVGQNVPVFVYTNGDSAELFLNGKSLGKRTKRAEVSANPNLALGKAAQASSQQAESQSNLACDGNQNTAWHAEGSGTQWLQVDLGSVKSIGYCSISFAQAQDQAQPQPAAGTRRGFGRQPVPGPDYVIKVSTDGSTWQDLVSSQSDAQTQGRAGRGARSGGFGGFGGAFGGFGRGAQNSHEFKAVARYVRVEFTSSQEGANGISEFTLNEMSPSKAYYDVTYKYRLRWDDVTYEPGELKAVAYKNSVPIGEAVMKTAGEPAKLRLTPDRDIIKADGSDLSYVLVEMLDADGTLCPLAGNTINFTVEGPAEIAAVGNGNPMSIEPFQASSRKLFYGKAMLILRSKEGQTGRSLVKASCEGLPDTSVTIECQ